MPDWDVLDHEEKQRKKLKRLSKNAAYCVGGGIALLVVHKLFPPISGNEKAVAMMTGLGFVVLAYGLALMTSLVFLRAHVFRINFFLIVFAVPAAIIKVLLDSV